MILGYFKRENIYLYGVSEWVRKGGESGEGIKLELMRLGGFVNY
jgi:hypothetical protein